jgi:hypothetical protein
MKVYLLSKVIQKRTLHNGKVEGEYNTPLNVFATREAAVSSVPNVTWVNDTCSKKVETYMELKEYLLTPIWEWYTIQEFIV